MSHHVAFALLTAVGGWMGDQPLGLEVSPWVWGWASIALSLHW